ncbi:50S ribosomal protein L29 [Gloeobacter kilaueensis]|uniref:Large ribosomal subunit protein uL29 n=1 Tax=Gloeobacter kilaueensis (strain ATCC BAA-2537 / CCAP 1431/1 / ULC 316 / JS1) TaxID=1183438 RepID=U5QIZ7_GLOK1|nr:50S ribosomal protein L29 [Gloeobacter kilaueensis]AGY58881.1 50S ribosomal protein L29 [Gloeobacter kilaueensis JS1]
MALPKFEELRDLSTEEIAEQILTTKKELFELRMQKATRQLEKPHLVRHAKHKLAQLMLLEGQRLAATQEK